jgi:hypothetical protein
MKIVERASGLQIKIVERASGLQMKIVERASGLQMKIVERASGLQIFSGQPTVLCSRDGRSTIAAGTAAPQFVDKLPYCAPFCFRWGKTTPTVRFCSIGFRIQGSCRFHSVATGVNSLTSTSQNAPTL